MLRACVLLGVVLVSLPGSSRADDAQPQAACWHSSCGREKCREFSLRRIWSWATYTASPTPRECNRWVPYVPAPMPPLYTFFLQGYGEPNIIMGTSDCGTCSRCR